MPSFRYSFRYLFGLMTFIFLSFSQLHASESGNSDIILSVQKENARRTIVFSTPFPEIAPTYMVHEVLYGEIFKRMGYDFKMVYHPELRELIEIDAGRVDGSTGRLYNIDNENKFPNLLIVPEPILNYTGIGIAMDRNIRIHGWESLRGYNIVHISGEKWIENNLPLYVKKDNISKATDWKHAFRILDAGRADIYIEFEEILTTIKRSDEFRNKQFFNIGTIATIDLFPYLNKKNQALLQPLLSILKAMKADGTFERLILKAKSSD